MLKSLLCQVAQGYTFSRPLAVDGALLLRAPSYD